jgi:hypothetical protein
MIDRSISGVLGFSVIVDGFFGFVGPGGFLRRVQSLE